MHGRMEQLAALNDDRIQISVPHVHRLGEALDLGRVLRRRIDFDQNLRQLAEHVDVLPVLVEFGMECLDGKQQEKIYMQIRGHTIYL